MPEIKNTFSQGKMNKDLDERLIPNGQYRHAENVDVTSSEDAAAGTVQNLLGNIKSFTNNLVSDGSSCVGCIANERTNKLYWFVKSTDRDAILEFNQDTGKSQCIAVDISGGEGYENLSSFLNFTGKQITGINIVDDFLFWTDGTSEPKKLNISASSQENPDLAVDHANQKHAYLYIDGEQTSTLLEEKHVTVIKKKPSIAPTVKINTAKNEVSSAIFEKVFPRFCFRYKYKDGEYSAFGPFTEVVFNPEYSDLVSASSAYSPGEPYNKAMVNLIKSIDLYDFVPSDIPQDVVQVDILYKQEDSPVIYSIDNIRYTDQDWSENGSSQFVEDLETGHKGKYTISSENLHAALPSNQLLRPFDTVPKSALSQEIIGNRLVYGNYKHGYNFEGNKPKVNAGYEIRESQDFTSGGLKSLKSLREYQLGVVLGDKYGRETPVQTSKEAAIKVDWFSSSTGFNASKSLMLSGSLQSELPDWVDYYKFYVKSTVGEYYNLIMDKSYFPFAHSSFENPDNHFYISFPSSDRNKITEDDYIIAKKVEDSSSSQVTSENKYKILDISNEAPEAVKYTFFNLGTIANTDNVLAGDVDDGNSFTGGEVLFPTNGSSNRIDQETNSILMQKAMWLGAGNGSPLVSLDGESLIEKYSNDIYISWKSGGSHSNRYKVSGIRVSDAGQYVLKLAKQISNIDARIAAVDDTITQTVDNMDPNLVFTAEKRSLRSAEDFSGKFFVKIQHESYLTSIEDLNAGNDFYVGVDAEASWLYGNHSNGSAAQIFNETEFIVNSTSSNVPEPADTDPTDVTSPSVIEDLADTADDWSALESHVGRTFFIDDMNFIASNPAVNEEWYAKESGEGWRGIGQTYTTAHWWSTDHPGQEFDEDENPIYSGWDFSANTSNLSPRVSNDALTGVALDLKLANSLEGIVTTTQIHTEFGRQWRAGSIYSTSGWQSAFSTGIVNYDTTYTQEQGKFFMHLSFLAPGIDLIPEPALIPDGLNGVELQGNNSIAKYLQGVWGGGIFSKTPAAPLSNSSSASEFGLSSLKYVEFEGNYDEDNNALDDAPSPLTGIGYNENYSTAHKEQWNPAFSDTGINTAIQSFVSQIDTGSQFKFKTDPSNTIYTIKSIQEKHIYNHTSWRMRWLCNGNVNPGTSAEFIANDTSVEEAASKWADSSNESGLPNNDEGFAGELIDKIKDFAAPHNRRTCYVIELDKNPVDAANYDPRSDLEMDAEPGDMIEFVTNIPPALSGDLYGSPTIWETEPQQLADLNIYYEASNNIPNKITRENREIFAPVGCSVEVVGLTEDAYASLPQYMVLERWIEDDLNTTFRIEPGLPMEDINGDDADYTGVIFRFRRADGSYTTARILDHIASKPFDDLSSNVFTIQSQVDPTLGTGLNWFNCFSFGNGIESNRIRDGFNKMQISSGARASATLEEEFSEEHRTNGLIYSGIYNSNSNVNNLNQFIAAEKITKDLNPTYGSIQKLFSRNTDLVALCEDRVIKILANKDALFNADGNPQLIATTNVLGQAVPFSGDYGISQHPESFASESYRAYFADKQRGAVLRLSMDGLTPISDAGMRDYFRDNLVDKAELLGSYNGYSKQYNLTIKPKKIIDSVINEGFSEGLETIALPLPDYENLVNENFDNGISYSGPVTIESILDNDIERVFNPSLDSSVTIVNHPIINVLVPSQPIFETQTETTTEIIDVDVEVATEVPVTIPDAFQDGDFTMFGFDTSSIIGDSQVGDPFSATYGFGSTDTKFYMDRFTNVTATSNNTTAAVIQMTGGFNGNDFDLGFGNGSSSDVSGNGDDGEWSNRVFCFADTGITQTPDDNKADGFIGSGSDLLNGGIIFRGSPNASGEDTPWGYINFPSAGFVSGGNNIVPQGLLDINSSAQNNWVFNGEEIEIEIRYRANNYGNEKNNYVKFKMFDGASLVDDDDLVWEFSQDSSSETFPNITSDTNAGTQDIVQTLKYKFYGGNIGDVFSNNLTFRLEVWTDGVYGSDDLEDLGETVITGFQAKKTKRLLHQDYDTVEVVYNTETQQQEITVTNEIQVQVGETDPIPLEPIPAWAEVAFPSNIEGYDIAGSLFLAHTVNFGVENPGEVISYYDPTTETDQTYISGESNGVVSFNQYSSINTAGFPEVPVDAFVIPFDSGDGFTLTGSLSSALITGNWYLIDVEIPSPLGEFDVINVEFVTLGFDDYTFISGVDSVQIGSVEDSGNKLKLELRDKEYDQTDAFVYRGLFRAQTDVENSFKLGFDASYVNVHSINILDVTTELQSGSVENWVINESLYQTQRAVVPGSITVPYSHPSVYYGNGKINFRGGALSAEVLDMPRVFSQELPPLEFTVDGYSLLVTVDSDFISGENNISEDNFITVSVAGQDIEIHQPGVNLLNINFQDAFDSVASTISFTGSTNLRASISNLSLIDATNYFDPGNVGSWVISGFDQQTENFISWNNDQIVFNAASSESAIHQNIGDLEVGHTFNLSFDLTLEPGGSITASYFNSAGLGFEKEFTSANAGQVHHQFTIPTSYDPIPSVDIRKLFVFKTEAGTSGTIDNVFLKRVITQQELGVDIQTISFNEDVKGWVSFKSFIPESGVSLSNRYFTMFGGQLWKHNANEQRNTFYNVNYPSRISAVLNQSPSVVKNFSTVNYEGSQAKVTSISNGYNGVYNSSLQEGWEAQSITTDLQQGTIVEFIDKENKWFNYIRGKKITLSSDIDTSSFNFQGLGVLSHTQNN